MPAPTHAAPMKSPRALALLAAATAAVLLPALAPAQESRTVTVNNAALGSISKIPLTGLPDDFAWDDGFYTGGDNREFLPNKYWNAYAVWHLPATARPIAKADLRLAVDWSQYFRVSSLTTSPASLINRTADKGDAFDDISSGKFAAFDTYYYAIVTPPYAALFPSRDVHLGPTGAALADAARGGSLALGFTLDNLNPPFGEQYLNLLGGGADLVLTLAPVTQVWTNPAHGAWAHPANWNLNEKPWHDDSVLFNSGATHSVSFAANETAASVTIESAVVTFDLAANTLTTTGQLRVDPAASLTITNGTVSTFAAPFINGPTTVAAAGHLRSNTDRLTVLQAPLTVRGPDARLTASDELHTELATLTVDSGGVVSVSASSSTSPAWSQHLGSTTIGAGGSMSVTANAFSRLSGSLTVTDGGSLRTGETQLGHASTDVTSIPIGFAGNATVTGQGSRWTISGPLTLGASDVAAGTLLVGTGATVTTGTLNVLTPSSGVSLAGGTFNIASLNRTSPAPAISWQSGTLNVTNGSLSLFGNIAALPIPLFHTYNAGHTLYVSQNLTLDPTHTTLDGAQFTAGGTTALTGISLTLRNNATLHTRSLTGPNLGHNTLFLEGGLLHVDGGSLSNFGGFAIGTANSNPAFPPILRLSNGATWTNTGGLVIGNGPAGTFEVLAGATFSMPNQYADLIGTATFVVDGARSFVDENLNAQTVGSSATLFGIRSSNQQPPHAGQLVRVSSGGSLHLAGVATHQFRGRGGAAYVFEATDPNSLLRIAGPVVIGDPDLSGYYGPATFRVASGATATLDQYLWLRPNGTLQLHGGSLTADSLFTDATPARLDWTTGLLKLTGPAGLTLYPDGPLGSTLALLPNQTLAPKSLTINANAYLAITGGHLDLTASTANLAGSLNHQSGQLLLADSSINLTTAAAQLLSAPGFTATGSTFNLNPSTLLHATGPLALLGGSVPAINATLRADASLLADGAHLTFSGAAANLTAASLTLGRHAPTSLTLTNSARADIPGPVVISDGDATTVTVSAGATLRTGPATVGRTPNPEPDLFTTPHGSVSLTGPNSAWHVTGNLDLGLAAASGAVTVSTGAALTVTGDTTLHDPTSRLHITGGSVTTRTLAGPGHAQTGGTPVITFAAGSLHITHGDVHLASDGGPLGESLELSNNQSLHIGGDLLLGTLISKQFGGYPGGLVVGPALVTVDGTTHLRGFSGGTLGGVQINPGGSLRTRSLTAEAGGLDFRGGSVTVDGGDFASSGDLQLYSNNAPFLFELTNGATSTGTFALSLGHPAYFTDSELRISGGAHLDATAVSILSPTSPRITVTGPGSRLTAAQLVAQNPNPLTVQVLDGARLDLGSSRYRPDGRSSTLVSGPGSLLTVGEVFVTSSTPTPSLLEVSNGGELRSAAGTGQVANMTVTDRGTLRVDNGAVDLRSGVLLNYGRVELRSGSLTAAGIFRPVNSSVFDWTAGSVTVTGYDFNVGPVIKTATTYEGATDNLVLGPGKSLTVTHPGTRLRVSGHMTLQQGGQLTAPGITIGAHHPTGNPAVLDLAPGTTWTFPNTVHVGALDTGGTYNPGRLVVPAAATLRAAGGLAIHANPPGNPAPASSASIAGTLFVGVNLAMHPDASLDLTGLLLLDYTGRSPLPDVRDLLTTAAHGGSPLAATYSDDLTWTGPGITSSTARNRALHTQPGPAMAVGYTEAALFTQRTGQTFLHDVPFDPSTVLVRHTLQGDATLDGLLTDADLDILIANYSSTTATWSSADFTYDGAVNDRDLDQLTAVLGYTHPTIQVTPAALTRLHSLRTTAPIPEPASALSASVVACLIAARRHPRRPSRLTSRN